MAAAVYFFVIANFNSTTHVYMCMCTCVCVVVSPVYAAFPLLSFNSDCAIVQIERCGGVCYEFGIGTVAIEGA